MLWNTKKLSNERNIEINPQYPYALTKRLGEELVLHFSKVYKLNATSLRFFNVYGPKLDIRNIRGSFGVFLAQKLANKPFTIVGNGKQTRDFTFVSDIVNAIIKVGRKRNLAGEIFNIGSGRTVSVNKIADLLKGKKSKFRKDLEKPEITFACINKVKENWMETEKSL